MATHTYTSLSLWCDRDVDQGVYVFGTTIDGADVSLAGVKIGHVDTLIESARLAAEQAPPPAVEQPQPPASTQ